MKKKYRLINTPSGVLNILKENLHKAFSNDYNDLVNKPAGKSVQNRYADMAAMFADQANQNDALLQYVLDASGDATVDLGYAYYEYLGTTVGDITDYVKLSEEESMDVVEKTNTSEFINDGSDGNSTYVENDEIELLISGKIDKFSGIENNIPKSLDAENLTPSRIVDTGTAIGIDTLNTPTKDLTFGNQDNKEIGIEESINVVPGKDLGITAGRTINFTDSDFSALNQVQRRWVNISGHPSGDVYAVADNNLYKQTNGQGDFLDITTAPSPSYAVHAALNNDLYISDGTNVYKQTNATGTFNLFGSFPRFVFSVASASNGDIYVSTDGGDIYKQTGGIGTVDALGQISRTWQGISCNVNGDVYACVRGGDIYVQTGGVGDFIALGQTTQFWRTIECHSNGNVYAACGPSGGNPGDIFMQSASTGLFNPLDQGDKDWRGVTESATGDVYAAHFNGDIYFQNNDAFGTPDLDGGALKLRAGTGKGIGQSKVEFYTGQKTVSGTDMQLETLRGSVDEEGTWQFDDYGEGNKVGTPTKSLTVDIDGNILERGLSTELRAPIDIRVIPNSVLPSTTLDVVVECKDMTSDSTVSFGTGLTINSQAVELNKFGSFVVRVNVTFDATEQAIDVTVNNGLSGTAIGILNVVNGTVNIPQTSDWTVDSGLIDLDITGEAKLHTQNVYGEADSFIIPANQDFDISFRFTKSDLEPVPYVSNFSRDIGLKRVSDSAKVVSFGTRYNGRIGAISDENTRVSTPNFYDINGVQWIGESGIDSELMSIRRVSGIISVISNRTQTTYYTFITAINDELVLYASVREYDIKDIKYTDLSTATAGEPYNDNYAKVGDNVSLFINDANYAPLNPISEIEVVPNSVLPSSTQDVVILGNDINENTTINISGTSTINSTIYELNKMGAPYLRANITFSATEEAIDITLDNGLVTIFSGVLNVVNGTVYEPSNIDWIITEPADVDNNSVLTQVWNSFGYAEWVKEFDNTVDYIVYYNSDVSPLGTMPLYYQYRRPQLALLNVSDDTLRFAVNLAQGSSATQYQFEYYSSDIAAWSSSKTFLSNRALGEIPIEFRFVSGIMYLYIDNVLKQTFATTITQTLKAKFEVRVLDVKNVKYTNLSTASPGDPYNDNYAKIGDNVSLFVNDVPYLKDGSNTSDLVNDGEDGINPYLSALESPYNTIIKGVASLIPTKYNLKNLFVTGTSPWTDDDADKYIKNYYVDIPNDTITFYITREYHLAIFAFNNSSSLNTITHYLDFDGFVTKPGNQTFRGNTNIQEVVFPRATGDSTFVFENNSALTKLHLPYLDIAWVQNASLLTDIDFSKAKSLINIKNIGAVGEMYAPLATVVGFNQASGITSWYLPSVETLSGNMYNNSPLTSLYAPNCKTYSALLRNANVITSLHLPNVTNASGLVARAFESDALTEIYMPKAKSFGSDSVLNGMFSGSTIGVGCTLTVNEFLRTSNGGAMNVNVAQAISLGIKVVFAKDVNIALDNRILNASVTTTYDFDHSRASDWKLTMIADTTFTESNLPTLDKTIEFTFKLTGAFVPQFPTYWDVLGDAYDGAVWNFIAVQIHDGNSGTEEATVFISNIV